MNPDGTNPATNTGVGASASGAVVPPALDFTSSDTTNLSMADSLASAADNLTSAGMAAKEPDSGSIDMGQIGASDPSATMERLDEPLIPAAPVPGSIGSVTSGPAVGASDSMDASGFGAASAPTMGASTGFGTSANGFGGASTFGTSTGATGFGAAPAVSNASSMNGVASSASAGGMMADSNNAAPSSMAADSGNAMVGAASPAVEAAPAVAEPYNPFTARMGGATTGNGDTVGGAASTTTSVNPFAAKSAQTSSMNVPASLQPATEKFSGKSTGGKKMSPLTVILGILAAVSLIMAIVFAVLWQQALSAEKVVNVPPAGGGDVDQTMAMVTCTKDLGADVVESFPGLVSHTVTATANFTNDQLGAIKMLNRYTFADATAAEATRPTFEATAAADIALAAELGVAAVEAAYEINGVTVNYNVAAKPEQLKGGYIGVFGLAAGSNGSVDTSRSGVQSAYEANDFACTED